MDLYLIRHAQSQNNIVNPRDRVCDPELTRKGVEQAEKLANYLSGSKFESRNDSEEFFGQKLAKIYTSPMKRALQTALIIKEKTNLAVEINVDLHEYGGIYLDRTNTEEKLHGITKAEVYNNFPGFIIPESITSEGWWLGGFEPKNNFSQRLQKFKNMLFEQSFSHISIGVITHCGFIDGFLKYISGADPFSSNPLYEISNTGISLLRISESTISIFYINDIHHL